MKLLSKKSLVKTSFIFSFFLFPSILFSQNVRMDFEKELDRNTLEKGSWVHIAAKDGDYNVLLKAIAPYVSSGIITYEKKNGNGSLRIATKKEIAQLKNNKGKPLIVSNYVQLKTAAVAGRYKLSCFIKGELVKNDCPGSLIVFCKALDKNGKVIKDLDYGASVSPEWKNSQWTLSLPEETAMLQIRFSLYGCGTIFLDDLILEPLKK